MSLVVTGATGQLGRHVVSSLLDRGVAAGKIVAVGRDEERLADLAGLGVQTRSADYNDPASVATALEGAERVLLISGSEVGQRLPQHQAVIDAAKAAGVQLLAYTSIANADTSGLTLAGEHLATEQAIIASGLAHTFLRNSWYLDLYLDQVPTYVEHGTVLGAAGDGRVSAAVRTDFAEAAAAALLLDAPQEVYELGGQGFTLSELAAAVTEATGTTVGYTDVPAEQLTTVLAGAGVPEQFAAILADADLGLGRGDLEVAPDDLATLLGRPATSLADALRSTV
ncbi:SDR family oxidoreductase [Nocardioides caeni]|uniref:SDR family oxidoreductase n=1 Tax=Nocardioides caeni TaxID=574700 RepID=A0A4S8NHD5_9ACTN|nr:SDR family oxidoreductase [Nocardioides caeni]THV16140.1 SDR family oxidoreductase [Nocardioides caeni]